MNFPPRSSNCWVIVALEISLANKIIFFLLNKCFMYAVTFSRIDPEGKLVMGFRKASAPGSGESVHYCIPYTSKFQPFGCSCFCL